MRTRRRFWIGLIGVAALTLAGGCGEDEIAGPTTNGDPPEPPEPPAVSAPASPTDVSVTVQLNSAWVRWMPGEGASVQDVLLTSADGLEPDRIKELTYVTTGTNHVSFADLTWGASYSVVVAAVNEGGRAESAPAGFEIPIPEAPVLTWFSATHDPTCLIVEWTASGPAEGYRVVLTGATEDASFEKAVRPFIDAEFCAADYPIVDGMTYTAQVVAEYDGLEVASSTRQFTVDFDPEYSLTGVWHRAFCFVNCVYWTFDLADVDGDISGSWTFLDASGLESSGRVTGTRIGGDFELALDEWDLDYPWFGSFEGPDRIWTWLGDGIGGQFQRD